MADAVKFNASKFINYDDKDDDHVFRKEIDVTETKEKPKRGRPRKDASNANVPAVQNAAPPVPQSSMSYIQENIPYTTNYAETNRQLDESINALNILGNELMGDLTTIRSSKTLKNKFGYINDITMTATSIIQAKLSAIKEKNNSATQSARFELERMKTVKSNGNEEDDNTRIANMYEAFINTPVGAGKAGMVQLAPPIMDMTMANPNAGFNRAAIGNDQEAWEANLAPEQRRMLLEAQNSIETVVMFDEPTGHRWYEILDKATGQPVPNVEKPDSSNIFELELNQRGGYAKDPIKGVTYRLITVNGGAPDMSGY